MININEVVKELTPEDIKEIVSSLGGEDYIEREKEIIFPTICHNYHAEDGSHKLYYYKNSGLFVCYTCCGTFDIAGLMCRRFETLGQDYNFYQDIVLPLADKSNYKEKPKLSSFYQPYDLEMEERYKVKENPIINLKHLNPNILNIYSNYLVKEWKEEGISDDAARRYQIRYSIEENKVIIPHYNEEGFLVGIRGRALNSDDAAAQGKYRPIKIGEQILSHPLGYNLYGLNLVGGNIKRLGMGIIFEGEKSVLIYDSYFGHYNNISVASCGSNISQYQIDLLISRGANKILIAFDKEGEDWAEKEKYYNKLESICKRYKNKVQMGFIWDSQDLLELKESPIDKGKEVFLELYWKHTIWI